MVGLIGLMLISTLIPIPGNFEVKVVKSGSMEPAIKVGGIVVIKPSASYGVGDIITFGADTQTQIPTTHRIVGMEGEGESLIFQTKGDANENVDPTATHLPDVHGKMIFTLPYLGYLLAFARTQVGFFLLVGVPALLVFFEEGKNIFLEIRRIRRKKNGRGESGGSHIQESRNSLPRLAVARTAMDGVSAPRKSEPVLPTRRLPVVRVMGALVIVAFGATWFVSVGNKESDTIAYYASEATSKGNSLGAAEVYDLQEPLALKSLTIDLSDGTTVVVDVTDTPPTEDVPPPVGSPTNAPLAEVPPVVEVSDEPPAVISEEPPADALTSEPAPVIDTSAAETPAPEEASL